jgi:hypothetical protein
MGQNKAGIPVFVVINKKDDDRRGAMTQAQKTVGEIVCTLNHILSMAGTKRKQIVMEDLVTSPTKKTSQKTGSQEVDAMIASLVYKNGI